MRDLPRSIVPSAQAVFGLGGSIAALVVSARFGLKAPEATALLLALSAAPMLAMEHRQGEPSAELNRLHLWTLKMFFIPLYGSALFFNTAYFLAAKGMLALVFGVFVVDVAFAFVGYLFASPRTFYSVQPIGIGWLACFVCYGPIINLWPDAARLMSNESLWPLTTVSPWLAALMLALLALYLSAGISFGSRVSNLGYRGVITSGPYRWMKHPAYFCHTAFAWLAILIYLPFAAASVAAAVALTVAYRVRSVTEERHLRGYPDYAAYCEWIAENGLLARRAVLAKRHGARSTRKKSRVRS